MSFVSDNDYIEENALEVRPRRQRAPAISSEVDEINENYTLPVYEKTEEEIKSLNKLLCELFLFKYLDQMQKDILIKALQKVHIKKDEILMKQNDFGDALYLIFQGSFNIFKLNPETNQQDLVNTLGAGHVVGELALLYSSPRAATVVATEDSICYKLERQTFNSAVKSYAIKKRKRTLQSIEKNPLFKGFKYQNIIELADAFNEVHYKKGEKIIVQGDISKEFYMLIKGKASVYIAEDNNEQYFCKYEEGEYFGELALLNNQPRAATIIADEDCVCLKLDVGSFYRLMGPVEEEIAKRCKKYKTKPS